MSVIKPKSITYTVGGTVQAGGGHYIPRRADEELLQLCLASNFAYVLTPRQLGKSSLMVNTVKQLNDKGFRSVIIDLTEIGTQLAAEQWYLGLLTTIEDQLFLRTDAIKWWNEHEHLGVTQRLTLFFQEVVVAEVAEPVVIFIDEIDTTLSLNFTDDFYAAIRYFYNARAQAPKLNRLSFVLIGVATPGDLIRDPQRTPFNIGHCIDLTDFTLEEALPLAKSLGPPEAEARNVLKWALNWTAGHPYLTQRLCLAIADNHRSAWSEADVAGVVNDIFLGKMSEADNNLQFVRDMLTKRAKNPTEVLTIYRDIRNGKSIRDEAQSLAISHLKLSGIVCSENGILRVRNLIYKNVFDARWINQHIPNNLYKVLLRVAGVVIALLITGLAIAAPFAYRQKAKAEANAQEAQQQRDLAEQKMGEVEQQRAIAVAAAQEAQQQRAIAVAAAQEAQQQRGIAEQKTREAQQQRAIAVAAAQEAEGQRVIAVQQAGQLEVQKKELEAAQDALTKQEKSLPNYEDIKRGQEEIIRDAAFSPLNSNGGVIATAGDGAVKLWKLHDPKEMSKFGEGKGAVRNVTFSQNGERIFTLSDTAAQVWDVNDLKTRVPLAEKIIENDSPAQTAFSPDGNLLAMADKTEHIQVWKVNDSSALPLPLPAGKVTGIAFSQDSTLIATTSTDKRLRVWDAQTGAEKFSTHSSKAVMAHPSFGRDDKLIVTTSGKHAVIWNAITGKKKVTLSGHYFDVNSAAFSPNGNFVVTTSQDAMAWLWRTDSGRKLQELRDPRGFLITHDKRSLFPLDFRYLFFQLKFSVLHRRDLTSVTSAAFSRNEKFVVTASKDGKVRVWDVETGDKITDLRGHEKPVNSVAFSLDNELILTASDDGTARIWNLCPKTPEEITQLLETKQLGKRTKNHLIQLCDLPDKKK